MVLSGWLYRCARFVALDAMRAAKRRQRREWEAFEMQKLIGENSEADWETIRPLLDEAVSELRRLDRDAICLRFYEKRSFAEIGERLSLSENAARMRVSRALEKLKGCLASKGIRSTALALGAAVGGQSAISAPARLSIAIMNAVPAGAVAATGVSTLAAVINIMNTGKFVAGVAALVSAVSVVSAFYSYRQADTRLSGIENEMVAAPGVDSELAALRARLSEMDEALAKLKGSPRSVLQTMGPHGFTALEFESAMEAWVTRVANLVQFVSEHGEYRIPEFDLLEDEDWLEVVGDRTLVTIAEYRDALSRLRDHARRKNTELFRAALSKYIETSGGVSPSSATELYKYIKEPIDSAILERYKVGRLSDFVALRGRTDDVVVFDSDHVDPAWRNAHYVGLKTSSGYSSPQVPESVKVAMTAFRKANGREPFDSQEVRPLFKGEVDAALFEDVYQAMATTFVLKSE